MWGRELLPPAIHAGPTLPRREPVPHCIPEVLLSGGELLSNGNLDRTAVCTRELLSNDVAVDPVYHHWTLLPTVVGGKPTLPSRLVLPELQYFPALRGGILPGGGGGTSRLDTGCDCLLQSGWSLHATYAGQRCRRLVPLYVQRNHSVRIPSQSIVRGAGGRG